MDIQARLFELQEIEYADFQAKLTPGIARDKFIGVRVPLLRQIAKELRNTPEAEQFLSFIPHHYYDENMLHALLLSEIQDFDKCIAAVDAFLPYVDNWAVCDSMSPKVFRKNRKDLLEKINVWVASDPVYTCRFGLNMLMKHFLDNCFQPEYLELAGSVHREEYYVNMMIAWFFATALAKQWDATVTFLEDGKLDPWVHNKTIQKAIESFRISNEQKEYLKTLKK